MIENMTKFFNISLIMVTCTLNKSHLDTDYGQLLLATSFHKAYACKRECIQGKSL